MVFGQKLAEPALKREVMSEMEYGRNKCLFVQPWYTQPNSNLKRKKTRLTTSYGKPISFILNADEQRNLEFEHNSTIFGKTESHFVAPKLVLHCFQVRVVTEKALPSKKKHNLEVL